MRRPPERDDEIAWDPAAGTIDAVGLAGVDAVVHLAGENIGQRWSAGVRERILRSRVDGTELLSRTIAALDPRPSVLVHASAVGYYGYKSPVVDEGSPKGDGFAADVAEAWERAADPAREAGIRVVALRQAPVQAKQGGALAKMRLPFRLGVGGRIGSGRQWWSWVSRPDIVRAYELALASDLAGPVNVAAGSTPNTDFVKALGRAMHRPAVMPVPSFAVKALFGQMGEEMLLGGQRPESKRLADAGFSFEHADLGACFDAALRD